MKSDYTETLNKNKGSRVQPLHPIYVPTKGRFDTRMTIKALDLINVPYRVVIEEEEHKLYSSILPESWILILPESGKGLVYSRNWILDHSKSEGHERAWQLDDNIQCFYRWHDNRQIVVGDGAIWRAADDFVNRYTNVAQHGLQYFMFAPRKQKAPPYILNTRIYSCTCNSNSHGERYRDTYNDDTDISLRLMKKGYCTILFNAFLCLKSTTMTVKGGLNTEEFYQGLDQRREFVDSLMKQHPDCVTKVWRYNRWHHEVDYRRFKLNRLERRSDWDYSGVDNYGMKLVEI